MLTLTAEQLQDIRRAMLGAIEFVLEEQEGMTTQQAARISTKACDLLQSFFDPDRINIA